MPPDTTLVIPCWHRPHYLRECLASWGAVRGYENLRRVTLRLARSNEALEAENRAAAAEAEEWFGVPVAVVLDDPEDAINKGPDMSLGKEFSASFRDDPECQFVIECDEDVIVSDDALEYVTYARSLDVACVCLHNDLGSGWLDGGDDSGAAQDVVRVLPEFTSYCFGFSREAWQRTWLPEWDWTRSKGPNPMELGWEWQMARQAHAGLRLAIPDASRCQNIGREGGTFSLSHHFEASQARSYRQHRDPVAYRLILASIGSDMAYSPNPLRHNPNTVGGLYCFVCKTPCTEREPCACEPAHRLAQQDSPEFPGDGGESWARTEVIEPPTGPVDRHIIDGDAGEAGDDSA